MLFRSVSQSRYPAPTTDRDQTVSRRFEPNSRTALIGEQPNPWDLLQPQYAMIRHRGAKPPRRCGLLEEISLLSPAYLLSILAMAFPYRTTGSLNPAFAPARRVCLAVKLPSAFALYKRFLFAMREPLNASVTFWEATTPVKLPTRQCPLSGLRKLRVRFFNKQGRYFKDNSTKTSVLAS